MLNQANKVLALPPNSIFLTISTNQNIISFQLIEYSLEQQFCTKDNFQKMTENNELFAEIHPGMIELLEELNQPRLQNKFLINQIEIQLSLTDNYLVLYHDANSYIPTHACRLNFDVKFEVLYQSVFSDQVLGVPVALKFQRQNCTQQLTLQASHPSIIEIWSLELEKKINQRNFHKLFKAKKKIGKGAFAAVYLAQRLRDHKMVAVKAFSKQKQFSTDKGKQALENQIKLMRLFNHDNIMKLEGVYETENSIYVILEYLQGQQLNDLIKSGKKLEIDETRTILQNILRGLSHLTKHRIIHRDLKPENIMFKNENCLELAIGDFGLATNAEQEKYIFVRCGTPGFVAPQIINIKDMNTKCDPVSDIFSAGIIFHHLLFGCSIFEGKKYNEVLAQNRLCELNFNREIYSKIDPSAFNLLSKMLEKDSKKRISADSALNHPFFMGDMDIEIQAPILFKNSINANEYNEKLLPKTPSSVQTRKQMKLILSNAAKENSRPFLVS